MVGMLLADRNGAEAMRRVRKGTAQRTLVMHLWNSVRKLHHCFKRPGSRFQ